MGDKVSYKSIRLIRVWNRRRDGHTTFSRV